MDPDLVGPAGLQPALEISIAAVPLQHPPVGNGIFPVHPVHGHFFPVHRVAGHGPAGGPQTLPGVSRHRCGRLSGGRRRRGRPRGPDHDHIAVLIHHIQRNFLGGGLDRLRVGFATTFINFAVFNIADICVCCGGALLGAYVVLFWEEGKEGDK